MPSTPMELVVDGAVANRAAVVTQADVLASPPSLGAATECGVNPYEAARDFDWRIARVPVRLIGRVASIEPPWRAAAQAAVAAPAAATARADARRVTAECGVAAARTGGRLAVWAQGVDRAASKQPARPLPLSTRRRRIRHW